MKNNKDYRYTVRVNATQNSIIEKLIENGTCKTPSSALQYIINMAIIKNIIE